MAMSIEGDDDELDDILCTSPVSMATPGAIQNKDSEIVNQINSIHGFNEPGSAGSIGTSYTTTGDIEGVVLPDLTNQSHQTTHNAAESQHPTNTYIKQIESAVLSLEKEIYESEQDRKESQISIEKEFSDIMQQIMTKKLQILQEMHTTYDQQKRQSFDRINELKNELIIAQKRLEIETERKEHQRQLQKQEEIQQKQREIEKQQQAQLKREQEQKELEELESIHARRISKLGNILKDTASTLAESATKLPGSASAGISKAVTYIDSLVRINDKDDNKKKKLFFKHDKMRLFIPKNDLKKLIQNDIKLTTEWWDKVALNHIIFKCTDSELWRSNDVSGGWYNAFGTLKVRKTQIKRWNVKICARGKHQRCMRKQPVEDVVLGVIESNKVYPQDAEGGFWLKGSDGFGLYGWNGKLFHKQTRGKMYSDPFYVGSTIGIELDMKYTPGKSPKNKYVPKIHTKNTKLVLNGGVVKFYIDDEDLGIAFYDLDLDKEYSLAVALKSNAYTLQLCN